jgi:hypothetical protein
LCGAIVQRLDEHLGYQVDELLAGQLQYLGSERTDDWGGIDYIPIESLLKI